MNLSVSKIIEEDTRGVPQTRWVVKNKDVTLASTETREQARDFARTFRAVAKNTAAAAEDEEKPQC